MPKIGFIIGLLFSLLYGCTSSSTHSVDSVNNTKLQIEQEKNLSRHQMMLAKLDSLLPISLNRDNYWIVFRYGSIEFSSDYSVLCIPKKEINESQIHCNYFMINNIEELYTKHPKLESDEPNILGFNILLNNNKNKIHLNSLKCYAGKELDKYVSNRLLKRTGEGHCNNFYFITSKDKDSVYVLDLNSGIKEKAYFEYLYKQISPSEYLQTFSLKEDCEINGLNLWIELNTNEAYKDSFILKHGDKGRYW